MKHLVTTDIIDRSGWIVGPWDNEPDKIQWRDTATGLPCLVVRNHLGAWCGYVGIEDSAHPWFGLEYMDCMLDPACNEKYCTHGLDEKINIHGGLTYASASSGEIYHVPQADEADHVWWLGFNSADAFGLCPRVVSVSPEFADPNDTYWTTEMVQAEVAKLAKQIDRFN